MSADAVPSGARGEGSLERAQSLIAAEMAAVDRLIGERLASDVSLVGTVARHLILAGGKRLRPALVLHAAALYGHSGHAPRLLAAVVEFIHTATLLHDDVVDRSELRRGRRTANALWGNAASVLVGDFLYSRAFQMMVEVGRMEVMSLLADTTNAIAEGEVMQLGFLHDPDLDEERYFEVIRRKTAILFAAAAELGGIVGGAPPPQRRALARYGLKLGLAFQIADDVLDLSADPVALGKSLGDDLREGKPTLPMILAIGAAQGEERERLRRAVREGGDGELAAIAALVARLGALRACRRRAERLAAEAEEALLELPAGAHREAMAALARYAVERDR
ncbi:MAG: polyprenyl synthetase family protein [Xanthomonadales bacterium]|nr:polyprenyl synthetase family protein [Xanthomonadales bacterium]